MTNSIDGFNWYVEFDGTVISGQANSCSLTPTAPENETTTFGSEWKEVSGTGVKEWSLESTIFYSEGVGEAATVLQDAFFAGGTYPVLIVPAGNTSGNKSFSGNAMVTEFPLEAGVSDGPIMLSLSLTGSGALAPGLVA